MTRANGSDRPGATWRWQGFPYVHDLGALLAIAADNDVAVPAAIMAADRLTDYAVLTRYPLPDSVTEDEHRQAVTLARRVVDWAESEIIR